MPDPADSSDPTQATEARLCAYLEGTLPDSERVEIESYLAQSPEHRKLLADLGATRQWLTELPRLSAPPEIAELFESQVERTMLLDTSASATSVRINRGPQVTLSAAIVLLAAGLATIIYLVLTFKGPTAQNYASSMKPSPAPVTSPAAAPAPVPSTAPVTPQSHGLTLAPQITTAPSWVTAPVPPMLALKDVPTTTAVASANVPGAISNGMRSAEDRALATAEVDRAATTRPAVLESMASATSMGLIAAVTRPTSEPAAAMAYAAGSAAPASTRPGVVAVGDRLSVDIAQLVGPGVEKTTTTHVEPDGSIALPMLDPMPAAGRTLNDLQKQIGDRYRQEHLINNPVVTVTRLVTLPTTTMSTTHPATQPTMQLMMPATLPTTRSIR